MHQNLKDLFLLGSYQEDKAIIIFFSKSYKGISLLKKDQKFSKKLWLKWKHLIVNMFFSLENKKNECISLSVKTHIFLILITSAERKQTCCSSVFFFLQEG